jgi:hypothetical protein
VDQTVRINQNCVQNFVEWILVDPNVDTQIRKSGFGFCKPRVYRVVSSSFGNIGIIMHEVDFGLFLEERDEVVGVAVGTTRGACNWLS